MKEKEDNLKYISLREATRFCSYSQKYLNLRAKQGRLKAVKLGRNWVTKKEWLEDYLKEVEEYKVRVAAKGFISPPEISPIRKKAEVPRFRILPVSEFRFSFVIALLFVLLMTGIIFFLPNLSLKNLDNYVAKINQSVDEFVFTDLISVGKKTASNFKSFVNGIPNKIKDAKELTNWLAAMTFREFNDYTSEIFKGYAFWMGNSIKKIPQAITNLFRKETVKEPIVQAPPDQTKEIEELKTQIQQIREFPVKETVKEVSRITRIEPVKEITYEKIISKIDDASLKILNVQIADLQTEMLKRLYAPGGVISQ